MNWNAISELGGGAVMAPAALLIAIWLVVSRAWSVAILWSLLFCAAALLAVGTKIVFGIWGLGHGPLDFTGISGHAMSATSVFAAAGFLLGSRLSRKGAIAAGAIGYGLGALVGVSAVMSQAPHSPSDVVAGCALGGFVALLSMRSGRGAPAIVAPGIFAFGLACIFLAAYGKDGPSEEWIRSLASYLSEQKTLHPVRANSNAPVLPNAAPPQSSAPTAAAAAAPIDVSASASTAKKTNATGAPSLLSGEAFQPDVASFEFGKYCAPPISPPCSRREETYKEPAKTEACQKEIDEYIGEALSYRSCLEDQIKLAVKNANDTIDIFKCRTQGRSNCPSPH